MLRQNLGHRVAAMMACSAFLQHSKMPPPQTASVLQYTSNGILSSRNILKLNRKKVFVVLTRRQFFLVTKSSVTHFGKKIETLKNGSRRRKSLQQLFATFVFLPLLGIEAQLFFFVHVHFPGISRRKKPIF